MIVIRPNTEWKLRSRHGEFGSFGSREEAESFAIRYSREMKGAGADLIGTAYLGEPDHEWKKCGCPRCRWHRECQTYATVPCRFTP